MKNLKIILMLLVFMSAGFIGANSVNAATATISSRASSSTVVIGNSVTVTVTVSSSSALGSWEFVVNYDSSKLKLTSTTNATYIADVASNASTKSKSYTYTFKALTTASTSVSVKNYNVIGWDDSTMSTSITTAYLKLVKPTVVVLSSNANLESLTTSEGTLSPAFAVNTLEYTISVNKLIDKITLTATKDDDAATVTGGGELAVSEGANAFEIKVTAENGTTKTYKVTVNVVDENPIKVTIDKKEYTVIKKAGSIDIPDSYTATTIPISGTDVAAYQNELTKLLLVGLKDSEGTSYLYVYDSNKETYSLYNEVSGGLTKLFIYKPSTSVDIPNGYKSLSLKINDTTVTAYKGSNSEYYLVYGMNVETGNKGFYTYDKKEKTFQRYYDNTTELNSAINNYIIALIAISIVTVASIVMCVFQLLKFNKLNSKVKKAKERHLEENQKVVS